MFKLTPFPGAYPATLRMVTGMGKDLAQAHRHELGAFAATDEKIRDLIVCRMLCTQLAASERRIAAGVRAYCAEAGRETVAAR